MIDAFLCLTASVDEDHRSLTMDGNKKSSQAGDPSRSPLFKFISIEIVNILEVL